MTSPPTTSTPPVSTVTVLELVMPAMSSVPVPTMSSLFVKTAELIIPATVNVPLVAEIDLRWATNGEGGGDLFVVSSVCYDTLASRALFLCLVVSIHRLLVFPSVYSSLMLLWNRNFEPTSGTVKYAVKKTNGKGFEHPLSDHSSLSTLAR